MAFFIPDYRKPYINIKLQTTIMKIICAGPMKTGTKSLSMALKILGYSVYDFPEQFYILEDKYKKVFAGTAEPSDFYDMFKDVDAVIDTPGYHYWKEILDAFPNAKVRFWCVHTTNKFMYQSGNPDNSRKR